MHRAVPWLALLSTASFYSEARTLLHDILCGAVDMDGPPLASLSLTHVYYDPADGLSELCAYLALVPQALTIIYVAVVWSSREIEILLMFAGQMGCEALNWCLKRLIREERPSRRFLLPES